MKKAILLCTVLLLMVSSLYAADGDLTVSGRLGVGTDSPGATLDVIGGAGFNNLVKNGGFNLGVNTNWGLYVNTTAGAFATASADTSSYMFSPQSAHIAVANGGGGRNEVQYAGGIYDTAGVLVPNRYYTLSFWAKASTTISQSAGIILHGSPYTNYVMQTINLTHAWQKYTMSFQYTGAAAATTRVQFFLGGTNAVEYWIDGVTLVPGNVSPEFSNQTLRDDGTLIAYGNVGIGTTSPGQKLSVAGTVESTSGGFKFPDGTLQTTASSMTATNTWSASQTFSAGATFPGSGVWNSSGNVGIGTTSPTSLLSVGGTGDSSTGIYGYGPGTSGTGIRGRGYTGVYGDGTYYGFYGMGGYYGLYATGTSYAVYGKSASIGVFGRGDAHGVYAYGYNSTPGYTSYGVTSYGGTYDFYAVGPGVNYGPFTGGHEVKLAADVPDDVKVGMIMSVTGETQARKYNEKINISSTLPTVALSSIANDKAVFGVFVTKADLPEEHWHKKKEGDRYAAVNALGEGRVLVTNVNGNVQVGDYITTSMIPGYGQRQNDDLLHSYTLGKAIEAVDWDKVTETIEFQGKKYKVYMIAVVYTSG